MNISEVLRISMNTMLSFLPKDMEESPLPFSVRFFAEEEFYFSDNIAIVKPEIELVEINCIPHSYNTQTLEHIAGQLEK